MRAWRIIAVVASITLVAAACGSSGSGEESDAETREVVFEPAASTGTDPFTESVAGDTSAVTADAELTDAALQSGSAPGLYGGSGDQQVCDQTKLVTFLEENPEKGSAWAAAEGIAPDEVGAYVESLTPAVLLHDTAVTNHGYANGAATAHQSVLEAGTAVLKDRFGVPRTRCACGNPLLPPEPAEDVVYPGDPIVILPGLPDAPATGNEGDGGGNGQAVDFCAVYQAGIDDVTGGPSGPSDMVPYLTRLQAFLDDLIATAESTPGFPEDALGDLTAYRDAIAAAVAAGDPSAVAGSTELRDAVEGFLEEYCSDASPPEEAEPTPPVADPLPDAPVPRAECGTFMFYLLIDFAGAASVPYEDVADEFITELEELAAGSPDLSVMLEVEEIGCDGAQALYDLLVDAGYEDVLDGSALDPYA